MFFVSNVFALIFFASTVFFIISSFIIEPAKITNSTAPPEENILLNPKFIYIPSMRSIPSWKFLSIGNYSGYVNNQFFESLTEVPGEDWLLIPDSGTPQRNHAYIKPGNNEILYMNVMTGKDIQHAVRIAQVAKTVPGVEYTLSFDVKLLENSVNHYARCGITVKNEDSSGVTIDTTGWIPLTDNASPSLTFTAVSDLTYVHLSLDNGGNYGDFEDFQIFRVTNPKLIPSFVETKVSGIYKKGQPEETELYSESFYEYKQSSNKQLWAKNIDGYRLIEPQSPSIDYTPNKSQNFEFLYEKASGVVRILAELEDGNPVPGYQPIDITAENRSEYNAIAPYIPNYELADSSKYNEKVQVTEGINEIVFVYKQQIGNVIVRAITVDWDILAERRFSMPVGDMTSINPENEFAELAPSWLLHSGQPVIIRSVDSVDTNNIFYIYFYGNYSDVKIRYLDIDNPSDQIKQELSNKVLVGQSFTAIAPDIPGWELASHGIETITAKPGSNEIVFSYRGVKTPVRVRAIEKNTGEVLAEKILYYPLLSQFTADSDKIIGNLPGFKHAPNEKTSIDITSLPKDCYEINFYYVADIIKITVKAVIKGSSELVPFEPNPYKLTALRNLKTNVTAPVIKGWTVYGSAVKTLTPSADTVVSFEYTAKDNGDNGNNESGGINPSGGNPDGGTNPGGKSAGDKDNNSNSSDASTGKNPNPVAELEKDEHISYLSGYPDNGVRPEKSLTRAETAMIFYKLLKDKSSTNEVSAFSDIPKKAWFSNAVTCLEKQGIISGYPNGKFLPGKSITRAEFAAIASKFDRLSAAENQRFTDVPAKHWAYAYIASAKAKGWISGYPDGSFKPETNISRAEAVSMINRVLNRRIHLSDIPVDAKQFTDINSKHWAFTAIMEAVNYHEYNRIPDGFELWSALNSVK